MRRGDLYRVRNPKLESGDPRAHRVYVVVSRQVLLDSRHQTVICAPVYSRHDGLSTQVPVSVDEGLKSDSSIHCDDLTSLPKAALTHYIGRLDELGLASLNAALLVALGVEDPFY